MGRPLDEMEFVVTRRPGAWTGHWVPEERVLASPVDGDPTPKSQATVTPDSSIFEVGGYAEFYTAADVPVGYAEITGLPGGGVMNFVTDSLTWDAAAATRVRPVFTLFASRPQPAGPELIDFLDEGARTTARYIIYADDNNPSGVAQPALNLVRLPGFAADTIYYNGRNYLVTADGNWGDMSLGHQAIILLEYGPDEAIT